MEDQKTEGGLPVRVAGAMKRRLWQCDETRPLGEQWYRSVGGSVERQGGPVWGKTMDEVLSTLKITPSAN